MIFIRGSNRSSCILERYKCTNIWRNILSTSKMAAADRALLVACLHPEPQDPLQYLVLHPSYIHYCKKMNA
jgi:hypothetical protein